MQELVSDHQCGARVPAPDLVYRPLRFSYRTVLMFLRLCSLMGLLPYFLLGGCVSPESTGGSTEFRDKDQGCGSDEAVKVRFAFRAFPYPDLPDRESVGALPRIVSASDFDTWLDSPLIREAGLNLAFWLRTEPSGTRLANLVAGGATFRVSKQGERVNAPPVAISASAQAAVAARSFREAGISGGDQSGRTLIFNFDSTEGEWQSELKLFLQATAQSLLTNGSPLQFDEFSRWEPTRNSDVRHKLREGE